MVIIGWAGPQQASQAGRVLAAARPGAVACDTLTDGCGFSCRLLLLPQPTALHFPEQGDKLAPALGVGTREDTGNLLHPHLAFAKRARREIATLLFQLRKGV